jgi:Helix-turn-helix domain
MDRTIFTSINVDDLTDIIKKCILEAVSDSNKETTKELPSDDLLNIEDIQKIFNVSKVTVHKWKKKGLIPFYKMNRKVYFKKSEVISSMTHKKRKMEV